jgi:bifunctional UDP-N-acetylglucosamine pyrophosphorylase/glucosamine-1-phosphate N-acetyltransferase
MIEHVLASLAAAGIEAPLVVTGHAGEALEEHLAGRVPTVRQEPQLGTAHAVRVGLSRVAPAAERVIVTVGDSPLIPAELFEALVAEQQASDAAITLLSAHLPDPAGYGRVVRDASGGATAIVEEADADEATRAIDEINVATYCFDAAWLRGNIEKVQASAKGELYLTDLVALAVSSGRRVSVVAAPRPELTMGINDRVQLAAAEQLMRREIAERHMHNGVTIVDAATTYIDAAVEIGQDARIEPWTVLAGATVIGQDAVIGPHTHIRDSSIGPRTQVWASVIEASEVAEDTEIGPFSHLRPGCRIGPRCKIGNYAELKNSTVGAGTQQHHFSYLGDAEVGDAVNVGAGVVTANYDGEHKFATRIGEGAFLGVDTMLRAPITIGPGAKTGAGAVVTRDVPAGKTVVGMPARPIELRRRRGEELATGERNPKAGGGATSSDA